MPALVSLEDVRAAAARIERGVVRTPLLPCPWAEPGRPLWLKPESLQPTGAFKLRGALNAVARLVAAAGGPPAGVVTHSSGNHAQALAWAARAHGLAAVVVMPDTSPAVKVRATRDLGAEVVMVPPVLREARAREVAGQRAYAFVPPFDHPDVIAGQGTVGLEIVADRPGVATVLVPAGGAGLLSGVAVAVRALAPAARVVGVEPELAGDLADSMRLGRRTAWDPALTYRTVADGVRIPVVSELTWEHVRRLVDDVVTVTEDAILDAVALLAQGSRLVAEPSGALAVAAYRTVPGVAAGGPAVAVVSGGNVDPRLLARLLARDPPADPTG